MPKLQRATPIVDAFALAWCVRWHNITSTRFELSPYPSLTLSLFLLLTKYIN
jgi:hypothetical protein